MSKVAFFRSYWFATVHKNNKRRTRKNFLLFAKIGLLLLGFCWPPKNSADRSDRLWHTRVTLASKTDNDQSSDSWKNLLLHTINLKDFENSSKVNGDVCQNPDTLPLSQSWRVIQKVHSSCKNGLAMVWHLALFSLVKGPCHVMTFRDLLTRDKALKLLWV